MPRFLGIALAGSTVFAVVLLIVLTASPAAAYPHSLGPIPPARWADGTALAPVLAYTLGLVAASGLCLPSFYFFGLLSGVKLSWLQVLGIVMRCKATSSVVLLGILPIYLAVVLGLIVFGSPVDWIELGLYVGLVLPFVAGLQGVRAIYRGVMGLADLLPADCRARRSCFLRRLTLSWAACYTAVAPVMIYRLWELFAGWLGA